jgi:hypothetical protein
VFYFLTCCLNITEFQTVFSGKPFSRTTSVESVFKKHRVFPVYRLTATRSILTIFREVGGLTVCRTERTSVSQSSEQAAFTSQFVDSILPTHSCESTLCRKSWVFSGCSGLLLQRKLTGWFRIKKVISQLL